MTEDEAKVKWCPFARYASINGEGINRWARDDINLNPQPARCIAGACMAWRWVDPALDQQFGEGVEPPEGAGWVLVEDRGSDYRDQRFRTFWRRPYPDRDGYCGFAGAPQ